MLTCKVKPSVGKCKECEDIAECCGMISNCSDCCHLRKTYRLINTGHSFWTGDYAIIESEGKLCRVSMYRVFDVREEEK